jgi:hypothetical protein
MCLIVLRYLCKETYKYPSNITVVYKTCNHIYMFRLVLSNPQDVCNNAARMGRTSE